MGLVVNINQCLYAVLDFVSATLLDDKGVGNVTGSEITCDGLLQTLPLIIHFEKSGQLLELMTDVLILLQAVNSLYLQRTQNISRRATLTR